MIAVPRLWPGETFVLIGSGPSLIPEDVDAVHGRARVIVINSSWHLAPWADVLYAADAKWWNWEQGAPGFHGLKYSVTAADPVTWPDVQVLENTGPLGLELEPTGLRTGFNSGYQAINLAVHLGAARILLLGYDLSVSPDGRTHWHGDHPDRQPSPYGAMLEAFPSLVAPLSALGISVVNCSRRTALGVFPRVPLAYELALKSVQDALYRCLVDGCYYGHSDRCVYCDKPRPNQTVYGQSPMQSLTGGAQ